MTAELRRKIQELFETHILEHRKLPESTRARDWGGESALIRDYSGRVVYELLQNAVDRADKHILISLDENGRLLVGNDGTPVSAFPLDDAPNEDERSDFHALLSLHSSNKSASKSIGNKGVGFRSVFSASRIVEIYSRMENGGWWGLNLTHPDDAPAGFPKTKWKSNKIASFYNPNIKFITEQEVQRLFGEETSDLVTVVSLELDSSTRKDAEETIKILIDLPLRYLEHRLNNPAKMVFDLRLDNQQNIKPVLAEPDWQFAAGEPIKLDEKTQETIGMDIDEAQVKVGFFTGRTNGDDGRIDPHVSAVYWSYLPTEQPSGFGVQVHGDFYLNNSRRNVSFSVEEDLTPAVNNYSLLKSAAKAIVFDLWHDEKVCTHEHFWKLADPYSSECIYLRHLVGGMLLEEDTFKAIVKSSFSQSSGNKWNVKRYQEFFRTVTNWADYVYRNHNAMGLSRYTLSGWNALLVRWIQEVGAPVLPILSGTEDENSAVFFAVPLPEKGAGGRKRDFTVFSRSGGAGLSLPEVFKTQQKYVTSFRSSSIDSSDLGMTDFNRVELIASLTPGGSEDEQRQLLHSVLRLASESQERGGLGSILERCQGMFGKHAFGWRYLARAKGTSQSDLEKAGFAASNLHVPTLQHGWVEANKVTFWSELSEIEPTLREKWPWPILDEKVFSELLPQFASGDNDESREMVLEEACLLLGIGPLPLVIQDGSLTIDGLMKAGGRQLKTLIAKCLIESWDGFLRPFFIDGTSYFDGFLQLLQMINWIPADLTDLEGKNIISIGVMHRGDFLAPDEVWLQQRRGGFRTTILSTYSHQKSDLVPGWILGLGICEVGDSSSEERVQKALKSLAEIEIKRLGAPDQRSLEETYRRLIRSKVSDEPEDIPILARRLMKGQMESLEWLVSGEKAWFDSGLHTSMLSAFDDILVWVVRREKANLAKALEIATFNPDREIRKKGIGDDELSRDLRGDLERALPDILAAADAVEVRGDLDFDRAIRNWASLEVRNYEDVWMHVKLGSILEGSLGRGELGDVFFVPADNTDKAELVFDIQDRHELPVALVECGMLLAEALFENREVVATFTSVLTGWSLARRDSSDRSANSINRMRRDLGIGTEDIRHWKARIESICLPEAHRNEWRQGVVGALRQFGEVKEESVNLGFTVTQSVWSKFSRKDLTQEEVQKALEDKFSTMSNEIRHWLPEVDFVSENILRFGDVHENQGVKIAAEYLFQIARNEWDEGLVDELHNKLSAASIIKSEEMKKVDFDPEALLRHELGIKEVGPHPEELISDARAFMKGELKIQDFPSKNLTAGSWPATQGKNTPLPPKDASSWEKENRRKHVSGERAENAVLALALEQAYLWIERDEEQFWVEVRNALSRVLDDAAQRVSEIRDRVFDESAFEQFIHVSKWMGNAGFDVLVPNSEENTIHLVEVKKVSGHGKLYFFLSENERLQAFRMSDETGDSIWRLWCVSDDEPFDATEHVMKLKGYQNTIADMNAEGIKINEYQFVVRDVRVN